MNEKQTRYVELETYRVLDAIKNGYTVYCLNRHTRSVFSVNKLSITATFKLLRDIDTAEDAAGNVYRERAQYELWYEYKKEESGNDNQ